jgi:adenylate cyclase
MSDFPDELRSDVQAISRYQWDTRDGTVIPETDDVKLGNDQVVLKSVVMLYADLADSTELAVKSKEQAAEVYKAYLGGVSKIIKRNDGEIRSFDGDRVMGVFLEGNKNTNAVRCGLEVNWFFQHVLVPEFQSFYKKSLGTFPFQQTVGIDSSAVHVARGGVRNDNDLIWVGRAPNVAAKLSAIRDLNAATIITKRVYDNMMDIAKFGGESKENMWVAHKWQAGEPYDAGLIYGSSWWWEL